MDPIRRIPVGISTCLLGDAVRYDGGHKRDRFLTGVLEDYVEWVPTCPEVGGGLGVPRESVRLTRASDGAVRMLGTRSGRDVTDTVDGYGRSRVEALARQRLRGYVLKKDSPSCGMERVRLFDARGVPARDGVGLFARRLMERFPNLPVEEEGRLHDPRLRENFIGRLFTYDRWLTLREGGAAAGDVVTFHTAHKMLILAHHPGLYREMGRLVARAGAVPIDALLDEYEGSLMAALRTVASPGRHANVLEHLAGFLKDALEPADKRELHDAIHAYRLGRLPLVAPLILLSHHLRRRRDEWVDAQIYLRPYPAELALRSSI